MALLARYGDILQIPRLFPVLKLPPGAANNDHDWDGITPLPVAECGH